MEIVENAELGGLETGILLAALRAAGEPTRLRILALTARAELTVSELTQILGQSQPRVSRHLKLLCDAGLLDRFREGTWVFYRFGNGTSTVNLGRVITDLISADDALIRADMLRLEAIKKGRAEAAADYFRANAGHWDEIRRLYVPESDVETVLRRQFADCPLNDFLDVGTGTGRMLELFGPRIERGLGVDASREMLAVARANLDKAGLRHCSVRHADMYTLPIADRSFEIVLIHQVLHYAERPDMATAEAARVLAPGGRLAIVDFTPHELEELRRDHAHRRLGFADAEIQGWLKAAGLSPEAPVHLPGRPLTVGIWLGRRPAEPQTLRRSRSTPVNEPARAALGDSR